MSNFQQVSLDFLPEPGRFLGAAWEAEISRRIAAIDRGRGQLVPWEEARKRMFSNAQEKTCEPNFFG